MIARNQSWQTTITRLLAAPGTPIFRIRVVVWISGIQGTDESFKSIKPLRRTISVANPPTKKLTAVPAAIPSQPSAGIGPTPIASSQETAMLTALTMR